MNHRERKFWAFERFAKKWREKKIEVTSEISDSEECFVIVRKQKEQGGGATSDVEFLFSFYDFTEKLKNETGRKKKKSSIILKLLFRHQNLENSKEYCGSRRKCSRTRGVRSSRLSRAFSKNGIFFNSVGERQHCVDKSHTRGCDYDNMLLAVWGVPRAPLYFAAQLNRGSCVFHQLQNG